MAGFVFISYSRRDREYVDLLASHLTHSGIDVWYDYEVETGEFFSEWIQRAVDGCSVFLVVLSPASAASEWVRREISRATRARKPMQPLLRQVCNVPIEMEGVQYEDVTGGQLPSDRFVETLRRTLSPGSSSSAIGRASVPLVRRRRVVPWLVMAIVTLVAVTATVIILSRPSAPEHPQTNQPYVPRTSSSSYQTTTTPTTTPTTVQSIPSSRISTSRKSTPPAPLLTVERSAPGCAENDHRVIWTPVLAEAGCPGNGLALRKMSDYTGVERNYGELRMTFDGQVFPTTYTVRLSVGGLSDPVPQANHLGCAGVKVHTTADGSTFEALNVCGDGYISIVSVANDSGLGVVEGQINPGQTNPSAVNGVASPTYVVVATVTPSAVDMAVTNTLGETQTVRATPVVSTRTSYVGIADFWRNAGATAAFSNFHYSSGM